MLTGKVFMHYYQDTWLSDINCDVTNLKLRILRMTIYQLFRRM